MLKCVSAWVSVVTDLVWLYSKLGSCECALVWQPKRQISRLLIYPAFQPTASGTTPDQADSCLGSAERKMSERENLVTVDPQL